MVLILPETFSLGSSQTEAVCQEEERKKITSLVDQNRENLYLCLYQKHPGRTYLKKCANLFLSIKQQICQIIGKTSTLGNKDLTKEII